MDDAIAEHYFTRPVMWLRRGEPVAGGPLKESGFYVEPFCTIGCCRPDGPFRTQARAMRWAVEMGYALKRDDTARQAALHREAKGLPPR